jgi:small subunit ribosomal protein S6e
MVMKLNIAYPPNGSQKVIELEDEKKFRIFFDKRIAEEVPADMIGDEFKGYQVKITGGFDKDGFAMKQGVLLNHRTRIVLDGTTGHYRPKRDGCRKRKSVRGCICGPDLSVINLVITKKGPQELPGLTDPDSYRPSLRGPKRASKIRKLWGLKKEDDVRQFVSRKKLPKDEKHKKDRYKSPKIQRLITPQRLQRKRRLLALKKRRYEKNQKQASEYAKILNQIRKDKRAAILSKRRKQSLSLKGRDVKATGNAGPAQPGALPAQVPGKQPTQEAKPAAKKAQEKPAGKTAAAPAPAKSAAPAKTDAPATKKQATKAATPVPKTEAQKVAAAKPAAQLPKAATATPGAAKVAQVQKAKAAQTKPAAGAKGKK